MTSKLTIEQLEQEISRIAQYIAEAKLEIAAIAPPSQATEEDGNAKNVAAAALQLNEVVRYTEEATNTIMDNAEALMALAGSLVDTDASAKVNEHALGILEACSFQDITGQRIKKVMSTLEQIELRIARLIKLFGGSMPEVLANAVDNGAPKRADEDLCNGPQLSKDKPSQEDIDKLFSSL